MKAIADLEMILGYQFRDLHGLQTALTHASAVAVAATNERLEFIGDRVLGLAIAETLYLTFPDEPEGDLAKRHASLVSRDSLASVAEVLKLRDYIRYAPGQSSAALMSITVLANTCEAVIGAIFLDGGYDAACSFVKQFWQRLIAAHAEPPRDAKSRLQEWAQSQGKPTPRYMELARHGPPHAPIFTVQVHLPSLTPAEGAGSSKQRAEQAAAAAMLKQLSLA